MDIVCFAGISDSDNVNTLDSIIENYKCDMALRNLNVIIFGPTESSDTKFTYNKIYGHPIGYESTFLKQSSALRIQEELKSKYRNLRDRDSWAILVGYDGQRKNTFSSSNVNDYIQTMFQQIDRMPMRQSEIKQQKKYNIDCNPSITSGSSGL